MGFFFQLPEMSPTHEYQDVSMDDQDGSATDVEESLVGEKSKWPTKPRKTLRHRILEAIRASWWVVNTSLLLIIVALLLRPRSKPIYEFGGDLTGFVPYCKLGSAIIILCNYQF